MRKPTFRGALVGTSVGLVAFGGVAAAAFWTTGTIQAPVVAGEVVVADVTATVADELFPGYLNDVTLTFTNPNPVETRVTDVTFLRFEGDPALQPYLISTPVLAPAGTNAAGQPRPLVLPPHETVTVTVADAVGLIRTTPNLAPRTGGESMQGRASAAVYSATYTATPGTETP
jgi:hypothetical protein